MKKFINNGKKVLRVPRVSKVPRILGVGRWIFERWNMKYFFKTFVNSNKFAKDKTIFYEGIFLFDYDFLNDIFFSKNSIFSIGNFALFGGSLLLYVDKR
ncbi:MAG TPA: hypothetical protein PLL66_00105 [Bacteroidales bacterium]|nr:hypothetical protein [Bacteroidales bacterium]